MKLKELDAQIRSAFWSLEKHGESERKADMLKEIAMEVEDRGAKYAALLIEEEVRKVIMRWTRRAIEKSGFKVPNGGYNPFNINVNLSYCHDFFPTGSSEELCVSFELHPTNYYSLHANLKQLNWEDMKMSIEDTLGEFAVLLPKQEDENE